MKRKTSFTSQWEWKPSYQKHASQHRHVEKGNMTPLKAQTPWKPIPKTRRLAVCQMFQKDDIKMIIEFKENNDNS